MDRWVGRVAIVTGASAGIGAAIAQQLVDHGVTVVALARRADKIEEAVNSARKEAEALGRHKSKASPGKLHARPCDVTKEEDILKAFQWIKDNLGGADILVNNAGLGGGTPLTGESNTADWRRIFDVNVLGLSICTREAVKSMKERGVDDGHVVHISSIVAHIVPPSATFHMYCASKHAVRALTEGLRKDLAASNSKIRVSSVSPGVVKTDFLAGSTEFNRDVFYQEVPFLTSSDIADAVLYALGVPPHVQIHEIIIKPVGENY